jgi:hypothetical protein
MTASQLGRLVRRRVAQIGLLCVLGLGVAVLGPGAPPASAACPVATASPTPSPSASATSGLSPHAFQGSVVALGNGGLNATVVRKDGVVVEVHGATGRLGATGPDDRIFVVGAVYQFEPLNDASPYRDSLCTGTKVIWSPTVGVFPETDPHQPWLGFSAFDFAAVGFVALMLGGLIGARVGFGRGRRAQPLDEDDDEDEDED